MDPTKNNTTLRNLPVVALQLYATCICICLKISQPPVQCSYFRWQFLAFFISDDNAVYSLINHSMQQHLLQMLLMHGNGELIYARLFFTATVFSFGAHAVRGYYIASLLYCYISILYTEQCSNGGPAVRGCIKV